MANIINLLDQNVKLSVVEGDVVEVHTEDGMSHEVSRLILLSTPNGEFLHDHVYKSHIASTEEGDYYTCSGEGHAISMVNRMKSVGQIDVDNGCWFVPQHDERSTEERARDEWELELRDRREHGVWGY